MPQLRPLNPAICTECGTKRTKRLGYSKLKKGSVWVCVCGHKFVLPLLIVARANRTK